MWGKIMKKPLIELKNIGKKYGEEVLFEKFNLTIYENEFLVIMGPSGRGKSTLLNMIGQLDDDFTGEIIYNPILFKNNAVPFPFVFQTFDTLLPWKTVEENIRLVNRKLSKSECDFILSSVSLKEDRFKYPPMLSGGMKQRVGIARALACHSKMMLMDEPFGSLDQKMREKLQNLIVTLQKQTGLTLVFVTHDVDEAEKIGTRRIVL